VRNVKVSAKRGNKRSKGQAQEVTRTDVWCMRDGRCPLWNERRRLSVDVVGSAMRLIQAKQK